MPIRISNFFRRAGNRIRGAIVAPIAARQVAQIAEKARALAPTKKIKQAISNPPAEVLGDGSVRSRIIVDLEIAPEGRAYEFGSGEHGDIGQHYPITPKRTRGMDDGKRYLAFDWENEPAEMANAPHLPDGRILLTMVWHPGVEPRPYLQPAIDEQLDKFLNVLGKDISAILVDGMEYDIRA